MRAAVFIAAFMLSACGAPAPTETAPDASAGSSGAGRIEAPAPFALEPEALVGVWSFDRTCASGDGMRLNADDTATFDEWGEGRWSIGPDNTVVLNLALSEPGVGPTGETVVYTLAVAAAVTDDLVGQLTSEGEPLRAVNARRCPG